VHTLSPPGAIKVEGTWSLGARAGDFVFVAGMQGVDPATNKLVADPEGRVRQAFLNIRHIAQSEGATLRDCVRLTVYVSDLAKVAAGRQGPGRAVGQGSLSATHHVRGQAAVRRRHHRDRQRFLCAGEKVWRTSGRRCAS
jgi:enamine deaminase RidA (YjgF/YER057c/UK114 family)